MTTVGVTLITHSAKHHLQRCLLPYLESPLKPRVVVVNSSSHDGTVEEAERLGAETLLIPRSSFNHGATRELARQHLATDIVVMATPDAYPENKDTLEKLIAPILSGKAALVYGRQLPRENASFLEAFAREFNYPCKSELRTQKDFFLHSNRTYFCSNAFAAYSQEALDTIGGFAPTLMGEDTQAAQKLLERGYALAYNAEARVIHSHNYSLCQEFCRHFDTGLYRHILPGGDFGQGLAFTQKLLQATAREHPLLLPYACLHIGAKYSGYKLGKLLRKAPPRLKRLFSSQDYYW